MKYLKTVFSGQNKKNMPLQERQSASDSNSGIYSEKRVAYISWAQQPFLLLQNPAKLKNRSARPTIESPNHKPQKSKISLDNKDKGF